MGTYLAIFGNEIKVLRNQQTFWNSLYLQPSACRRPPARARIGRQLNDTIPCSIILVGALEVHIWLGEFVDVYFKVV